MSEFNLDFLNEPTRHTPIRKKTKSKFPVGCLVAIGSILFLAALGSLIGKQSKSEDIPVYVAKEEIICATDASFLDSSPLLSPANFIRVPANVELVACESGGFGKLYWGLTHDGDNRIYVYDHTLKQKFKIIRYYHK